MNYTAIEEEQRMANVVFNNTIVALAQEGYITEEQSNEIRKNYSIILETGNWLPGWLTKALKLEKGFQRVSMAKIVGRGEEIDGQNQ